MQRINTASFADLSKEVKPNKLHFFLSKIPNLNCKFIQKVIKNLQNVIFFDEKFAN